MWMSPPHRFGRYCGFGYGLPCDDRQVRWAVVYFGGWFLGELFLDEIRLGLT